MAIAPGRACRHPGCVEIVKHPSGYCPAHRQDRRRLYDDTRPSSRERGYGVTWQRFRAWFIQQHPLCERCKERGQLVVATVVHHILPISDRPDLRLVVSNCQALCHDCHEIVHGRKRPRQ